MVLLCTRYTKFQCLPGLANTIQAVTWQQEKEGGGKKKEKNLIPRKYTKPMKPVWCRNIPYINKGTGIPMWIHYFPCGHWSSKRQLLSCDVLCCASATWPHKIRLCVDVIKFGTDILNEPISKDIWGERSTSDKTARGTHLKINGERIA